MELTLSKRLKAVASYVEKGSRLADIGSDHAYLSCYLIKESIASSVIAGEVAKGPYESSLKNVAKNNLTKEISVRLGDGLEVIKAEDQVDCVTIAGMGGSLILEILEAGKEKLSKVSRLILQANVGEYSLRKWLTSNNWAIVAEEILRENDKTYEIIVAQAGENIKLSEEDFLFGPILRKKKSPLLFEKWSFQLISYQKILKELEKAQGSQEIINKRTSIEKNIALIEELLKDEED